MSSTNPDPQIQALLEGLSQPESKRRESIALAIAKTPTYDPRIIAALKEIALNDAKPYARDTAVKALGKIAEAHFEAGNDIRTYLEKLRTGALARHPEPAPLKPVPETPPAPIQALPKLDAQIQPKPIEVDPKPVIPEPRPIVAAVPIFKETAPVVEPTPAPDAPPAPQIPFDQWLLSERNIKFALYFGRLFAPPRGLDFRRRQLGIPPRAGEIGCHPCRHARHVCRRHPLDSTPDPENWRHCAHRHRFGLFAAEFCRHTYLCNERTRGERMRRRGSSPRSSARLSMP